MTGRRTDVEGAPSGAPFLKRLARGIDRLVDGLLGLTVLATSLAMFLQVVTRYVFNAPISWAEEFAVFIFAWMIFIGTAQVHREQSHLAISTLRRAAGSRAGRMLDIFRAVALIFVMILLIWQGLYLTERTTSLEYPAMRISRGFLYASVPICFSLSLYYVLRQLVRLIWTPRGTNRLQF